MQDQDRYHKLVSQMEKEDADFFDYANEVLNECKVGGRPLYPIQKTIHVSSVKSLIQEPYYLIFLFHFKLITCCNYRNIEKSMV